MSDNQRIREIVKHLKFEFVSDFARAIGYERPEIIYNVLREKNKISYKLAQRITQKFPELNFEWVHKGEGTMTQQSKDNTETDHLQLADPSMQYQTIKDCIRERDELIHKLQSKLEKYENDGCPRCAEKDKSIQRLYDLLKDWSSGASRDYREQEKATDTG